MSSRFVIISIVFISLFSCQTNEAPEVNLELNATRVPLGDSTVFLISSLNTNGSILLLNVHENEQTAIKTMISRGWKDSLPFLFLHQREQRRIFFKVNDTLHSIDPNRMFTTRGIRNTLMDSMFYTQIGQRKAEILAEAVLKRIENRSWIVTMHNNTQDNYSILSYVEGGDEAMNAEEVVLHKNEDPDDFILTTNRELFVRLKSTGVNVVLQAKNPLDDGSLSVYCEQNNIPYVNIEAQHGHLEKQMQLLDLVLKTIEKPIRQSLN
ncbi:MAG: hypothetical protein ACO2Z9_01895 [Crocinitomicaceae bacterium]